MLTACCTAPEWPKIKVKMNESEVVFLIEEQRNMLFSCCAPCFLLYTSALEHLQEIVLSVLAMHLMLIFIVDQSNH